MSTYTWTRPNEDVKFKGFSDAEIASLMPAMHSTDKYLKDTKRLNATFIKKAPTLIPNKRLAAETRYSMLGGRATVRINPQAFERNRYEWNPPGVVSHEIGHLIGPTRNTTQKERNNFRKAFSYRQKKVYHELAPQVWNARRNNPVKGLKTRQSLNSAEDFAETWRTLTGEGFTNRTNGNYFSVVTTPKRVEFMQRYYIK